MMAGRTHTPEALALVRQGLDAALEQVAARLRAQAEGREAARFDPPEHSALTGLAQVFGLTAAEVELLAVAAGNELDEGIGALLGGLDVASAEALIPGIWDVLCPEAPLRRWRLIDLLGTGPLRTRAIRLDERMVHAMLGTSYLDARLEGLVHRHARTDLTPGRMQDMAEAIARTWGGAMPVILLGGSDRLAKRDCAAAAAGRLGMRLFRLDARDIPADWTQRAALIDLLDRELALSGAAVLIEAAPDAAAAASALADRLTGPTLVSAPDPEVTERAPRVRLDLDLPDAADRLDQWRQALGPKAGALGDGLDRMAAQFALDGAGIMAAAAQGGEDEAPALWQAARVQGRRALDGLAERLVSRAVWDDLLLPAEQMAVLRDLEGHLRDAWRVNRDWGWEARNPRGLGAAALFAGPSGTGKTLAAEVLAGALDLDLYRIDLSQVVSKYIGETEKNLSRIFTAADTSGAILLFDEADALFGKRSEVKDSHDRYANVEVSYLLQKMEAYRGLAVLTSNQKSALDTAFLRRLRYVVNFPFPDLEVRAGIWARVFPAETPLEGVRPEVLARLNVSGGSIRSIALNAAYLAAAVPEPVRMAHLQRAARREYAKLEKPFTAAEQGAFR